MKDKITCPKCSSTKVVDIVYGYPSADLIQQHTDEEIYLGGCCIEEYQPQIHCNSCGNDFGGKKMSKEVELLEDVKKIMHKHDKEFRENGGYMNVFDIVNSERYEVRTHSNIIYYLLNPFANHCMNDTYLKLFVKNIGFPELATANLKIEREKVFKEGRIDFVVECYEMCIAIEMKIDALDGFQQLYRYSNYCEEKLNKINPRTKRPQCEDYRVCFLTLDNHDPTSQSINGVDKEKFIKLSFAEHIVNWLKDCIVHTDEKMQAYSALKQYLILIEKLIKRKGVDFKVFELLMNSENYRVLQKLKDEELIAKQQLFSNFCKMLLAKLPEKFEVYQDEDDNMFCNPDEMFNLNKTVCINCVTEKLYTQKNGVKYNIEIILEISNKSNGALKIGYALLDKQNDKYMKYPKNPKQIFDDLGLNIDEYKNVADDYWLSCDYLLSREDYLYWFKDLSEPVINMFEQDGMMSEINHIVAVVESYLLKIGSEGKSNA